MDMETIYRHTQVSRATLGAVAVGVGAAAVWSFRVANPGPLAMAVLAGGPLALFSMLTVSVRDQALDIFFAPGLVRKCIPLHRIRAVRVVRNPWYYGWGIKLTPVGWLWNVSGLNAVEVQFENGDRFRVGSDEPDALATALRNGTQAV